MPKLYNILISYSMKFSFNRYRSKKEKKIACPLLDVFACRQVSSPRLYRLRRLFFITKFEIMLYYFRSYEKQTFIDDISIDTRDPFSSATTAERGDSLQIKSVTLYFSINFGERMQFANQSPSRITLKCSKYKEIQ